MKWMFLFVASSGVVPLSVWLRRNPTRAPIFWIVVGFLILQHGPLHVYMGIIDWAGRWIGYTYGFEISLLDLILFAAYISLPRQQFFVPFKFATVLYFLTVLLSAFQAIAPEATLFYAWQLLRVFFAYVVITKSCKDPRVAPALLKGMAAGLLLALWQAIWERYGLGVLRASGSFGQQNFFGVVSHFIIFPFFALLLAGERGWLSPTVSLGGLLISVLTISRATVAASGLGYAIMIVLSAIRGWTSQKALVVVGSVVATLAISPLFISSFATRFGDDVGGSFLGTDLARVGLEEVASMILSDHPMGVGANHFVVIANTGGYYARAGLSWVDFNAIVHNVYWLVAAETGYVGLIAFVFMLVQPMVAAFRCGWRNRDDERGDLLLGLSIALLTVYVHSFYEWIFVTFQVQYIFAATVGLIAGVGQQLGYWSRTQATQTMARRYFEVPKAKRPAIYPQGLKSQSR